MIIGKWMNPVYYATGLELTYSLASIVASSAPIITHSEQPLPYLAMCFFSFTGFRKSLKAS